MPQLATEHAWSDLEVRPASSAADRPASSAEAKQFVSYLPDETVAKAFANKVYAFPWVKNVAYLSLESGLRIWTFMDDVENEEQQEQVLHIEGEFFVQYTDREFGFRMVPAGREIPGATLIPKE